MQGQLAEASKAFISYMPTKATQSENTRGAKMDGLCYSIDSRTNTN